MPSISSPVAQLMPHPFLAYVSSGTAEAYLEHYGRTKPDSAHEQFWPHTDMLLAAAKFEVVDKGARNIFVGEDHVAALKKKEQRVLLLVRPAFFLPADEEINDEYISFIAEASPLFKKGTVVYVRETNKSCINFVLPHLRVSSMTGQLALTNEERPQPITGTEAAAMTYMPGRPIASNQVPIARMAAAAASAKPIKTGLAIVKNFKFIFPSPYGDGINAALSIFELILGSGGPSIADAVKELKDFMEQRDVNNWVRHVHDFINWWSLKTHALHQKNVDATEYIINDLLSQLQKAVDDQTTNSIVVAINGLSEDEHVIKPGVIDQLCLSVAVYCLALKMRVQLEAVVARHLKDQQDPRYKKWAALVPAHYDNFRTAILGAPEDGYIGWADRIDRAVDALVNVRMARISPTKRTIAWGKMTRSGQHLVNGWGFYDLDMQGGTHSTPQLVCFIQDTGDWCCDTHVGFQKEVEAYRQNYVAGIENNQRSKYGEMTAFAKGLREGIISWPNSLPPLD
ncbi:hypothetical protein [Neolewinella persica]|uniref:hypothetical protein n=1 Tax=Neolewinella persica TaxID=70998 RepID=UPI00037B8626|nr:hypothetical protein [Neolewinella persica]